MYVVALLIATAVPLIFLYIVHTLDLYGTGSFKSIALAFGWGGLSVALAYLVNNALVYEWRLVSIDTLIQFVAPFVEEILKAAVLIYLVRRADFTYFVDGAIYGFAAGIGFAVFENYFYIYNGMDAGLGTAVSRVLSTNLMHATASGIVGIALGRARFARFSGRALSLVVGLALAMAFHVGFNNLVTRNNSSLLMLYAAVGGFGGLGFISYAIKRGLAEEKEWIEETLGEADRVTGSEARAVQQLADAGEMLAPLAAIFGAEKAEQIEDFLVLQARLGILRKTLQKINDEKMATSVQRQMDGLREEMDAARRAVGTYCMMYLRNIFPEDASPMWGMLEGRIQEKIAQPSTTGINLWATIGQHSSSAAADAATTDR